MIRRTRRLLPAGIAAPVLLLAVLLAACGGGSSPSATPSVGAASSGGGSVSPSPPIASPTATPIDALYVVQAGDTLDAIAARFGVSLGVLMQANSITDPASLQVGQVLTIPGVSLTPAPAPTASASPGDTPSPVSLIQLVDKQHPLPADYVPPSLVVVPGPYAAPGYNSTMNTTALDALERMLDGASTAGYDIRVVSGYRSYADQQYTYDYWVGQLGQAEADRVSAKPGYSEHQLGMTADLGSADFGWALTDTFGATPDGQWLAGHAVEYGFVLSYPQGKEATTGYAYEPWHFRYIGTQSAAEYAASGLTLNQYLAAQ
ncbi:MAG: D-alanyl-D-alanine carboxypeptidase family protein [Chloroflexota bacterium]|nr:D-alanyl-D-alanine carboxypeptidase family protein [Chloroflexota bacterium]